MANRALHRTAFADQIVSVIPPDYEDDHDAQYRHDDRPRISKIDGPSQPTRLWWKHPAIVSAKVKYAPLPVILIIGWLM